MSDDQEIDLLQNADRRARQYVESVRDRRVFPPDDAITALSRFDEALPRQSRPAEETLALLDEVGGPATVTSNGPHYYGFVIGATHPAAAAAERLPSAWDQCASSFDNSPAAHHCISRTICRFPSCLLMAPKTAGSSCNTAANCERSSRRMART